MTDPAGKLHITRDPDGVTITSTRPVRAAGIFVGRGVAETLRLLPALFSVCATAQSAAGCGAIEQALGLTADPETTALRRHLVEAETLREHLWRILLDWPGFLGEAADAAAMARVMHLSGGLRTALAGGADPFAPGATGIVPDRQAADFDRGVLIELAADQVFGLPPAKWPGRVDRLDPLTDWAERTDTVAGRLVRQVIAAGQAGLGRSAIGALPPLAATELDRHLAGHDPATDAFVARPAWEGEPRETSPLTRQLDSPLVRDLTGHFGTGLLTRLAAQLTEVAGLLAVGPGATTDAADATVCPLPCGVGLAQVQAARGLLVHRVRIDGGRVAEYRILAPTEWNFHPQGVLATGLTELAGLVADTDPAALERLARLFIAAVDPCVDYDLQLPGPDRRPRTPD